MKLFRLLLIIASALTISCQTLAATEQMTVGVLKDAKPGSYRDEKGDLMGFSVDVARALCKTMAVDCTLIEMGSLQELIDAVASNRVDFVPASLLETPERAARMLFTDYYFRSSSFWVVRKGTSLGAPGLRMIALRGSVQLRYVQTQLAADQKLIVANTVSEIVAALENGNADASVQAMFHTSNILSESKLVADGFAIFPVNAPELTGDAKIAVTKAKPLLRDRLNQALKVIRGNGTLERINSRYLPFRVI